MIEFQFENEDVYKKFLVRHDTMIEYRSMYEVNRIVKLKSYSIQIIDWKKFKLNICSMSRK